MLLLEGVPVERGVDEVRAGLEDGWGWGGGGGGSGRGVSGGGVVGAGLVRSTTGSTGRSSSISGG